MVRGSPQTYVVGSLGIQTCCGCVEALWNLTVNNCMCIEFIFLHSNEWVSSLSLMFVTSVAFRPYKTRLLVQKTLKFKGKENLLSNNIVCVTLLPFNLTNRLFNFRSTYVFQFYSHLCTKHNSRKQGTCLFCNSHLGR